MVGAFLWVSRIGYGYKLMPCCTYSLNSNLFRFQGIAYFRQFAHHRRIWNNNGSPHIENGIPTTIQISWTKLLSLNVNIVYRIPIDYQLQTHVHKYSTKSNDKRLNHSAFWFSLCRSPIFDVHGARHISLDHFISSVGFLLI